MVTLIRTEKIDRKETPINTRDKVIVVGAGNVAMDAARTAIRLGASKVTVIYRRTEEEVTALPSEMEAAKAEGVEFQWLSNPTAILGTEQVTGLEYELQEIDENGKLRGTGVKEIIEADKIIPAIGQRPAARIVSTTEGIEVSDNGYVITRERPYGMTTRKGVFAGGDVVHQPATVVLAMKEAKKLAAGIAQYVEAKKLLENC
jgi:glutamate synthase (NADPH/NADH) small chain